MKREDKELLFKDLCARLPYNVIVHIHDLNTIDYDNYLYMETLAKFESNDVTLKPYLRPMSSMTDEEKKEFNNFCVIDESVWKGNTEIGYTNQAIIMSNAINWLLKKHFDFLGLIPKGLAIEVTENNNPYK